MKKKLLIGIGILLVSCVAIGIIVGPSSDKGEPTAKATQEPTKVAVARATAEPKATSTPYPTKYFCGFDRCKGSGEYGKLIFPTGINVWNNPDPDRGGVHHKASHGDKVTVVETKRVSSGSGGLWFKLEGGGWTNDLWLTDEPCTQENLADFSLDDC